MLTCEDFLFHAVKNKQRKRSSVSTLRRKEDGSFEIRRYKKKEEFPQIGKVYVLLAFSDVVNIMDAMKGRHKRIHKEEDTSGDKRD